MDELIIIDNPQENVDGLIISCIPDSPLTLMERIELELNKKQIKGIIIVDQILHSGNNQDRFISLRFDGKIDKKSIQFQQIDKKTKIREISCHYLKENNLIDDSILSSTQKRMLNKGISI